VVSAHDQDGQIVLDEPVEPREGIDVEALRPDQEEMIVEQWAELEAAVEEGAEQCERGEVEDARAFAARLVMKP